MILQGKVTSGIGTAKMWVSKIENVFKEKTQMQVFKGTLNIKLEKDYIVEPDFIIDPGEYGGTEKVLVKKCELFGKNCYIVRAEKNQLGKGEHNLKIIEIVTNINLRKTYKIKDNDEIEIKIF